MIKNLYLYIKICPNLCQSCTSTTCDSCVPYASNINFCECDHKKGYY